jgi:hypothetical protein
VHAIWIKALDLHEPALCTILGGNSPSTRRGARATTGAGDEMLIPRSARVRPAKLAWQEPCTLTGALSVRPAMFPHRLNADRVGRHTKVRCGLAAVGWRTWALSEG